VSDITPRELLFQVREMADPDGAQELGDDVERLWAIVQHIEGNLLQDLVADDTGTNDIS
jgi:hypothetical protein